MRLLLINSIGKNKWGGGEKWMVLAAKELIKKGHHVIIGCRRHSILEQRSINLQIPVIKLDIYTDFSIPGFFQVRKAVKSENIDIIIGCQNKDVRVAGFVSKSIGGLSVISRQGVQLLHNSIKYKWGFLPFCDGIITNTNSIKNEYDSYEWWDKTFVRVIHNGISTENKSTEVFNYSSILPPQEQKPFIVLSTGRLSTQKGFQYLIEAAKQIVKQNQRIHFFIAGQGKLEHHLKNLINRLQLNDNVHLIGFHKNVTSLLNGADLFVLPSLYEGMPNSLMEALAHGVPAVCTRVNGVSELMRNGDHGTIIAPGETSALEKAILELSQNNDLKNIGLKGKEHVAENFSINKMVTNLESYLLEKIEAKKV